MAQNLEEFLSQHALQNNVNLIIDNIMFEYVKLDEIAVTEKGYNIEKFCAQYKFNITKADGLIILTKNFDRNENTFQIKPRELIRIFEGISSNSPFYAAINNIKTSESLHRIQSQFENIKTLTLPVRTLPKALQSEIYNLLQQQCAKRQIRAINQLTAHCKLSLLSGAEFRWFNLFKSGNFAFGYRLPPQGTRPHKEILLSHNIINDLQGINISTSENKETIDKSDNANKNFSLKLFNRVETDAAMLPPEKIKEITEIEYRMPQPVKYLPHHDFSNFSLKNYFDSLDISTTTYPENITKYFRIFGKTLTSNTLNEISKIYCGLTTIKECEINKYKLIPNPIKIYKSPYRKWITKSMPIKIQLFLNQYEASISNIDFIERNSNIAKDILERSSNYIRNRVEINLEKTNKLKIDSSDEDIQMAFCDRLICLFALEGGFNEFEAEGGLHEKFDKLDFRLTRDNSGKPIIEVGHDLGKEFHKLIGLSESSFSLNGVVW